MTLLNVKRIDFQTVADHRGTLCIAEVKKHIPFPVERIFYISDIPAQAVRGGHAHRQTEQLVVCMKGSFCLRLTDGDKTEDFLLNTPGIGIYVPPMVWDHLCDFTEDTVCLVLASKTYQESDYIRDWQVYLNEIGDRQNETSFS